MEYEPKRISNSPIDFVVVGPVGGRDRVWIRSEAAGLEILGLSAAKSLDAELSSSSSSLPSALFGPTRQLNVIETYPVDDIMGECDDRQSSVRFAWAGYCSTVRYEAIRSTLNTAVHDLRRAILQGNHSEIEWAIAPTVFLCAIANERRLKSRRNMIVLLALYGIAAVFAILLQSVFQIFKL